MIKFKNVQGSMEHVKEVDVNVDTVYLRYNIRRNEENTFWVYDETQYDFKEYIEVLSKQFDDTYNYLKNILEI